MKIYCDQELLYEVSESQIKSLSNRINKNNVETAIKSKIKSEIQSFCDQALEYLKKQWMARLAQRYESIPTSDQKLIDLIISQPDYQDEYSFQMNIKMKNDQNFFIQ